MPWTARDAHRHKHGLSARQARQWARVANSMLQRCLNDGTSQATCEARAIRGANAAVGTPHASTNQRRVVINTAVTVAPARIILNEQEYLTAPAVLVVEGVLNNGLIPGDELHPQDWDGVAVTVNHPVDAAGLPHSARQPQVIATCGIGRLYHTRRGTATRGAQTVTSLHAELWINLADAARCGGEAVQAVQMLESQTPLEVSTAFYSQAERIAGSFHGVPYTEIHHDLLPDHLALLPNTIGACNWQDGCGAPRLHEHVCASETPCVACAERSVMSTTAPSRWQAFLAMLRQFVSQEEAESLPALAPSPDDVLTMNRTDADTREALYAALAREMETDYTPIFIDSIDTPMQAFVYRQGERLLRRRWSVDSTGILTLDTNTEDVQRDTNFLTIPGTDTVATAPDDSNPDLPHAFAVQPRCPTCQAALPTHADGTATLAPCTQCRLQASVSTNAPVIATTTITQRTAQTIPSQERVPMTTPVVSPVAIKARVNNLIVNKHYGWGERDRAMLEALPEATLIRLESQPVLVAPPEPPPAPEPPKTAQEAIAQMAPHLQDMFSAMYREHQERRQAAMAVLIAHKSCPFEQDELQEMSVERLEKLVAMGAGVEYTGKGLPAPRPVPEQLEAPPEPPNTMERVLERQKAQGLR